MGPETGVPPRKDIGPEVGKGPGTRRWSIPLPPEQTHTCENITFRHTSHAGGNNYKFVNGVPQPSLRNMKACAFLVAGHKI